MKRGLQFKDDEAEVSGFRYAFLKAQNREMWTCLQSTKLTAELASDARAAVEAATAAAWAELHSLRAGQPHEPTDQAVSEKASLEQRLASAITRLEARDREAALRPENDKPKAQGDQTAALAAFSAAAARAASANAPIETVAPVNPQEEALRGLLAQNKRRIDEAEAKVEVTQKYWAAEILKLRDEYNRPFEVPMQEVKPPDPPDLEEHKVLQTSLESQVTALKQRWQSNDVNSSLLAEVDQMASNLDELRAQNTRLIDKNDVVRKQLGTVGAQIARHEALEMALQTKLESSEYVVAEMKSLLRTKDQVLNQTSAELDASKRRVDDANHKTHEAMTKLVHAQRAVQQAETAAKNAAADKDQVVTEFTQHLADAEARFKAERTGRAGRDTTDDVDKIRIRQLTRKIQCRVCHEGEKAVVISRCFHAFCKACIDTVIANRSRKCPACGKAFGAADVHPVFLVD